MRSRPRIDLWMYLISFIWIVRRPAVFAAPLLAAVVALLLGSFSGYMTDPLGGFGAGIFQIVIEIAYGFALGVAVIFARDCWRGRRAGFDSAWEEARGKAGSIVLATIGFWFIVYVAALVGGLFGAWGGIGGELVATFFLIYAIPAAAIGGFPGSVALSASIRAVRNHPLPTALLAIVFILLWFYLPSLVLPLIWPYTNPTTAQLAAAVLQAVTLGYLAFPLAKGYDEVSLSRLS
ncbi:MAG: hypothetical protein ACYDGW_10585 [Vulcanimicrobiaceae bacterium]